jgi:O-antigen ligase
MAAVILGGPIIANSRGGAAIAVGEFLAMMGIFAFVFRRRGLRTTALIGLILLMVIFSAAALQWKSIQARLTENSFNSLSGRAEIYENSYRIAADFPLWGTGPGTFTAIYYMYRSEPSQAWMAMTHDDFLQTLVTFGSFGLILVLCMVALALVYPFLGKGIKTSQLFSLSVGTAMGGCLVHARFDFPLQLYSIFLLFLTLCSISMSVGKS